MKYLTGFLLLASSLLFASDSIAAEKAKVIAHRGYWQCEGSAQNSISSLDNAARAKVYGSEFDVQLTADDIPVVFHDNNIGGAKIWDMTYQQLLKDHSLANSEPIPTLDQYLEHAKGLKDLVLILEIKNQRNADRSAKLAAMCVEAVKRHKLTKRTEYISFDLDAALEVIRLDPKAKVANLSDSINPEQSKEKGFTGIDYNYMVFQKNPQWFDLAKSLGLTVNVWTVNDMKTLREMVDSGADYITTDRPTEALKEINAEK